MAITTREAIRGLLESSIETMQFLLDSIDQELPLPSSHVCAQGKDVWTLITNDIDHEKIHVGQVIEGRYEARIPQTPMQRLAAEWFAERAQLIGSLVGLSHEALHTETAPGGWTYAQVARHVLLVEKDSLETTVADRAARATTA